MHADAHRFCSGGQEAALCALLSHTQGTAHKAHTACTKTEHALCAACRPPYFRAACLVSSAALPVPRRQLCTPHC